MFLSFLIVKSYLTIIYAQLTILSPTCIPIQMKQHPSCYLILSIGFPKNHMRIY